MYTQSAMYTTSCIEPTVPTAGVDGAMICGASVSGGAVTDAVRRGVSCHSWSYSNCHRVTAAGIDLGSRAVVVLAVTGVALEMAEDVLLLGRVT